MLTIDCLTVYTSIEPKFFTLLDLFVGFDFTEKFLILSLQENYKVKIDKILQ